MALKKKKFKPKADKVNTTLEKEKENTKQVSIDLFANKNQEKEKVKTLVQSPPVPPNINSKDDIFEYNKKEDFMGQLEKDLITPDANFEGAVENNELSEIINSKHSQGELLINEFLDDDDDEEIDFFTKNTCKKPKNSGDQNLNLKSSSRSKSSQKTNGDKTKIDTRDIYFLMQRYKEDNNGVGTTDICILFSYWQINFDPDRNQKSLIHENQTLINYNSKSFNNKTYFNQNRPMSLDRSPLEENFNLDQIEQHSIEGELKTSGQNYGAKKDQKSLVPKINFGKHKSYPQTGQREQSDPRQVDSILYSQKLQQEPNDIQLGNVKNQMFFNQHNQSKRNSQNSIQHYQKGNGYGREIDRNQLSVEIMNITPIMEEKGEFQQMDHPAVKNFEIKESIENIKEEQFSFDQDLNFHPQGKNQGTNEINEIEERFSINYLNSGQKRGQQKIMGNMFLRQKQIGLYARKFAQIKQGFPIYYKKITTSQVMFGQTASLQLVRACQNIPLIYDLGHNLDDRLQLNLDQLSPIKGEVCQKKDFQASYLNRTLKQSPFKYFLRILGTQAKLNITVRQQYVHRMIYLYGQSPLRSSILTTVSDKWMERNIIGQKKIIKDKSSIKVNKFPPDSKSPVEAAFDCLSSIDSADNNDDVDEGEVLEVLQSNASNSKDKKAEKTLKNDDLQYQQIKEKNLNKYRDKSQTSDFGLQTRSQNKYVTLGSRTRGDGSRAKDKSSKRNHQSESKKDRKKRKRSKYGGESSKSKSKSRFSNNLGLTQTNKDTDMNDGDDIQKLIEEIDNDKNELDQFISQEEEKYTKKFEHITSEAERKLQNSHRDGSNNRQDSDRALNFLFNNGGREQSQTQRIDLGLQNQHHNSISNHSGSFYFNLSKKVNIGAHKSNNVSIEQNQHPYNAGVNYNNRSGMQNQRDGSVGMFINDNRGASGFNMNQSSSSSSSSNTSSDRSSNGQNKYKNISHQVYHQTSQLLTDRPNIGKKLDLGRVRGSINKKNSKINAAQGDKSNERGVSIISGNSNPGGLNKSYQNKQRFLFSNQLDGNNQQYSSLSRVGIKKISSGYSNGGLSNQSPSNRQITQFQSNQKLAAFANNSNVNNSKHSNGGSAVKNRTSNHNVSGFMTNTQNSYRTLNFAGQNQGSQNPILLKLQSTQISRGAANANATQNGGSNSILLQTQEFNLNNPALSQRNHTSSIQSIITPKSIGLKGPSQINFQGGNQLNSKTSAYTQQKSGQTQPIIRNINLNESNKKDMQINPLQNMSSENSPLFKQGSKEQSSPSEVNAQFSGVNEVDLNEVAQTNNAGGNQKQILSIKMLKTKSIKNIDVGPNMGSQSSRVPVIGKFGASVSIANAQSNQSSSSKLRMRSLRGAKGQNKNTTLSHAGNPNITQSKLSDRAGNSSVGSEFNEAGGMSQRKMKLRVKPRNFMNNTQKNLQKPQNQTETLETDPDWNPDSSKLLKDQSIQQSNAKSPTKREQRRDRNSRGLRSSITSQNTLTAQKQRTSQMMNESPSHASAIKNNLKPQMKNIVSQFDEEQAAQQVPTQKRESKLKQPSQYQKYGAYGKNPDAKQSNETQFSSRLQQSKDQSNIDQVQQQYQIHQQPIQKPRHFQNTSLEVHDQDRLIALLINEFKRKKGKNIKTDVQPQDQVSTLLCFWKESLCSSRIKHKLTMKLQQSYSHTNNKSQSISSKLSDKEKWLLAFLEGTDKTQLMKLGKDSTTRNYGELACIEEQTLINEICRYLGIMAPSDSINTMQSDSQSKRHNFEGGSQSISNASNNDKPIVFQFFINNN